MAEETQGASEVVAKGMWMATMSGWLLSIPTFIIILFCMQDFDGIVNGLLPLLNWYINLLTILKRPIRTIGQSTSSKS